MIVIFLEFTPKVANKRAKLRAPTSFLYNKLFKKLCNLCYSYFNTAASFITWLSCLPISTIFSYNVEESAKISTF